MQKSFKKKLLASVLSACMFFQTVGTVPIYAVGNETDNNPPVDITTDTTTTDTTTTDSTQPTVEQLIVKIDSLPNIEEITDENREAVKADLEAVVAEYEKLLADETIIDLDIQLGTERVKKLTALREELLNTVQPTVTPAYASPKANSDMTANVVNGTLWLFANGTAITIEEKGTGTIIKANDTEIDLATLTTETSIKLSADSTNGYDLSFVTICGGSYLDSTNTTLTGNTSITMNGGTVGMLVGGCYVDSTLVTVNGDTSITVNGGKVGGNNPDAYQYGSGGIVGGGFGISATVNGNTTVTITDGEVHGIVGGGCGHNCTVNGDTNVTIEGGTIYRGKFEYTYIVGETQKTATGAANFVGGGMGEGANVTNTHVTITGGNFTGVQIAGYVGGYYEGDNISNEVTGNAYLTVTDGTFSEKVINKFYSKTGEKNSTSNTYYYINTAPLPAWFLEGDAPFQLLTNQKKIKTRDESFIVAEKTSYKYPIHYIYIDESTKTYTFDVGNGKVITDKTAYSIGMDYTIPVGYTLTIAKDYTLTIPAGVTITNEGAISIEGTLLNNGTISGTGSIVSVGGTYTPGTGASPATVEKAVSTFKSLAFVKGDNRGDTKITIDGKAEGNNQYYKVTTKKPPAPAPDAVISTTGMNPVDTTANIPVALKDWVGVYEVNEVNSESKVVKFSCVQMTADMINGETAVDKFPDETVLAGENGGTTKITVTADNGNSVYYAITKNEVTNLLYNSVIDTKDKITVPIGGEIDTQSEIGKYLNVYEVTEKGYLRKFVSVKLTELNVKQFDGGLVADNTNKIIYCGDKIVSFSGEKLKALDTAATEKNNAVINPALYVFDGTEWKKAIPKNLTGEYKDYTLKGGTKDATKAAGTLYILCNDDIIDGGNVGTTNKTEAKASTDVVKVNFYDAMPKGAENFENFIIPDLANKNASDDWGWKYSYTVGGIIDLAKARQSHLKVTKQLSAEYGNIYETTYPVKMSALNIKENGVLTLPDQEKEILTGKSITVYKSTTVYFTGKATDIKGNTNGIINIIFKPYVDVKLYDKDGNEFKTKEEEIGLFKHNVYQVPKDQQVTVVAVISTSDQKAGKPSVQTPTEANPTQIPIQTDYLGMTDQYAIGFSTINNKQAYDYYTPQKVSYSNDNTNGVDKVTTLTLTISAEAFSSQLYKKEPKRALCVYNNNILKGEGQPPKYSTLLKDVYVDVTKAYQKSLTITDKPDTVTYGDKPFMLKTSGEGKGAVTWKSSNETVATVDANTGEVTINKVGSTIITATKAEDDDYFEASVTYTLKVQEKPISGTVTIDIANGKDSEESKIDTGDTLTANITLIEPAEVTKDGLTYQWYRGTDKIDGETNKTYVVTDADTDKTLSVLVTPKAGGNFNGEVKSAEVEVGKELIFGSVSITGDETVGNTLTLDKTKLTPEGATFTTKWQRDGVDIAGAAKETYKLTKADLGKTIGVVITATDKFTGSMTAIKEIPPVKPEKPVIKTTAGNGQVALTWTAPFDGGSTITGYKLTVTPSIKGSPFTIAGSATSYTVTGLTNGTKYNFTLTAINQVGNTDSDAKTETPVSSTGGGSDSGGSDSGGSDSGGSNSGGSNSGGSNSGGSNSGGSNSGDSDNIAPNPNEPTVPTTTVTEVTPIMDKNGNANVSITDKIIDSAIKKAQDEAKKNGTVANGIAVVIKVKTNKTINNLTATLPKSVQEKLIVAGVKNVTIRSGAVDIAINLDALKQMKSTANSDVNITAIKVDNSKLSAEAKKAVGNRPIIDFKVTGTNGKTVSDFGKGSVSISVPYTLANGEKAGNVVAVYINGAGKVEYLTSSSYNTNTQKLMLATNHFSTYGVAYKADTTATTFSDIANHWAKDAISFVTARGLFTGTGNGKFSPNASMTRGMFVTALGRLVGANVSSYKKSSFTDVKAGSYYMGYVEWANKNGIVKGISATTFAPDQSITREQMAVIIANYAKTIGFDMPTVYTAVTFADNAKISNNAKDSVKAMQMAGILMGKDGNLFDPQGTVTRAEVSAMLKRFVELAVSSDTADGWHLNDSGKWMYFENGKAVIGKKNIDGKTYEFDQYGITAEAPKRSYVGYTVQKGDSFWAIARKHHCNMFKLAKINGKTIFSIIRPGDVLKVPEN